MKLFKIAGFVLLAEALGSIGALFTTPKIPGWYTTLEKPFFSPPNWVFGPVWTILFALLGIALYIVWEAHGHPRRKIALLLFGVQFGLNILWSLFFFGLESPLLGFIDIVLLLILIVWMMVEFKKISSSAGRLLIPYILWVGFATILNFSIWLIN